MSARVCFVSVVTCCWTSAPTWAWLWANSRATGEAEGAWPIGRANRRSTARQMCWAGRWNCAIVTTAADRSASPWPFWLHGRPLRSSIRDCAPAGSVQHGKQLLLHFHRRSQLGLITQKVLSTNVDRWIKWNLLPDSLLVTKSSESWYPIHKSELRGILHIHDPHSPKSAPARSFQIKTWMLEMDKPTTTGLNMSNQFNHVFQRFTSHNQYPSVYVF